MWLSVFNTQYKINIFFLYRLILPSLNSGWISGFTDA